MKLRHWLFIAVVIVVIGFVGLWNMKGSSTIIEKIVKQTTNKIKEKEVGQEVDNFNGVAVYYNGRVGTVIERNTTSDGYNLGLKYQCVEFVKRYYYEHLNHKMPETYGHAKDFFDNRLADGQLSTARNLKQYKNPSKSKPKVNDLLVFDKTMFNAYGHVAIVSKVWDNKIELIQQNPGPFGNSRETVRLENENGSWKVDRRLILGWLRKE